MGTRRLLDLPPFASNDQLVSARIVSGNGDGTFRLDETHSGGAVTSGNTYVHVETTRALDRETQAEYRLGLELSFSLGRPRRVDLIVSVLDINDNPPVFEVAEYTAAVNRSSPAGTTLIAVSAVDADAGKNARLSYHLQDKFTTHFALDPDSGELRTRDALRCNGESNVDCPKCLSDPSGESCTLLVYARDGGRPEQSAYAVVKVDLLEANDHDPEIAFRHVPDQSKDFSIVESDADEGNSVAAVTVTDKDSGVYGKTTLQIIKGNEEGNFRLEAFGSSLYVVKVASGALFERNARYQLVMLASDGGQPSRTSEAILEVRVDGKNNFGPVFGQKTYTAEVSEAVVVGSPVLPVKATDEDNNVVYTIIEADPPALLRWFRIHPFSGMVTTASKLDRETADIVRLSIRARDNDPRPKSAFAAVVIKISDVNDEKPIFGKDSIEEIQIGEDAAVGSVVHTVRATDADSGENGIVTYRLGRESPFFRIERGSGNIIVASGLDRELTPKIHLTLVAEDAGEPPMFSTQSLTVSLVDVNDNSPVFYPKRKIVSYNEGHDLIVKAEAFDADEGDFAKITYHWDEPRRAPSFLELDSVSGEVTVKKGYHRDVQPTTFRIIAADKEGKRSPEPLEVQLVVHPVITEAAQEFVVEENRHASFSREIAKLDTAGLPSGGQFQILDGDPLGVFQVDETSGILTADKQIDREVQSKYSLKIAYRLGSERPIRMIPAHIAVSDLNDNVPTFEDYHVDTIFVEANLPFSAPVYKVAAVDEDAGDNGRITFRLRDASNEFTIDGNTGVISLAAEQPLQHEREFTVTITDNGRKMHSAERTYKVITKPMNRHTPSFDFDLYEISVSEKTDLNTKILSLIAVDRDEGSGGLVSYKISKGGRGHFEIFPNGDVYLQKKLDRETVSYYSLIVTATDAGSPSRSSTTSVVIHVADENDNAPRFNNRNYVFSVRENQSQNTVIGGVAATDLDLDRNAELTYSLSSKSHYFSIDPKSGFMTSLHSLDREKLMTDIGQDNFQLTVLVEDNGILRQSDTTTVNIVVEDENDNAPEFSKHFYVASVSENTKIGSEIITVHAKDADKGDNGKVTYGVSDSRLIKIDPETGVVSLASVLDRETLSRFEVTLYANDSGSPHSLSAETTLHLTVIDVNDNDPEFNVSDVRLELSEDVAPGSTVYQFRATDRDAGENGRIKYFLGGLGQTGEFYLDAITGEAVEKIELLLLLQKVSSIFRQTHPQLRAGP